MNIFCPPYLLINPFIAPATKNSLNLTIILPIIQTSEFNFIQIFYSFITSPHSSPPLFSNNPAFVFQYSTLNNFLSTSFIHSSCFQMYSRKKIIFDSETTSQKNTKMLNEKRIFFHPQRTQEIKNKKKYLFLVDVLTKSTCFLHFWILIKKLRICHISWISIIGMWMLSWKSFGGWIRVEEDRLGWFWAVIN